MKSHIDNSKKELNSSTKIMKDAEEHNRNCYKIYKTTNHWLIDQGHPESEDQSKLFEVLKAYWVDLLTILKQDTKEFKISKSMHVNN